MRFLAARRDPTVLLILFAFCLSVPLARAVSAAGTCTGDVNGDLMVTAADVELAAAAVFDDVGDDEEVLDRSDVNGDGELSAGDVVAIAAHLGANCGGAQTATPTRTATPSATQTRQPTATRTRPPTATPTAICSVQQLALGTSAGALADGDCQRLFQGQVRLADEYELSGVVVGQAIRVDVTANGFTPWVRLIDPNGYFDLSEGQVPAEFMATATGPYRVLVSSSPRTTGQVGDYSIQVTSRACETRALSNPAGVSGRFDGTECPSVFSPRQGAVFDPADVFTFDIATPMTLVTITMRQSNMDSAVDPGLTVFSPDGYEVFPADQSDDAAPRGFGLDAQARFLATQTGKYSVIATSGGCDGSDEEDRCAYSLVFKTNACDVTEITNIPSDGRKSIRGTHYGDQARSTCAAPPSAPGLTEIGDPEVGSPADVYSVQANVGDVITLEMQSEDEAVLFLYGPAAIGSPLIAVDSVGSNGVAQIGAALAVAGKYTVVATISNALTPPDPEDPGDEGDSANYTLFVQKCGNSGGASTSTTTNGQFGALDCVGKSGVPVRSYILSGTAGDVLSVRMDAGASDAALTLVEPSGHRVPVSSNPFAPNQPTAHLLRDLPVTGTYVLEASLVPSASSGAERPAYSLSASTCQAQSLVPGTIQGTFAPTDCDLGGGRRFDVWRGPGDLSNSVAGFGSPANGCLLALLPDGSVAPSGGCTTTGVELPAAANGSIELLVAAASSSTSGSYQVPQIRCAAQSVGYGSMITGNVAAGDCLDLSAVPSDWYLFSDNEGLVRYSEGVFGSFVPDVSASANVIGIDGSAAAASMFPVDSTNFFPLGAKLGFITKVSGSGLPATGSYRLNFSTVSRID